MLIARMAGIVVLGSLLLAHFMGQVDLTQVSWLWMTLLVGANLLQYSFTGWCPMCKITKRC